jgi:hypothetical protein
MRSSINIREYNFYNHLELAVEKILFYTYMYELLGYIQFHRLCAHNLAYAIIQKRNSKNKIFAKSALYNCVQHILCCVVVLFLDLFTYPARSNLLKTCSLHLKMRSSINIREYRRVNQNRTIQRNWQHRVLKMKKNKTTTQHNMCCTQLYNADFAKILFLLFENFENTIVFDTKHHCNIQI